MSARSGFTMTELLIASAIGVMVVIGIVSLDTSRFRMQEDMRRRSGLLTPEHGRTALAAIHLTKHLERADLLDLSNPALPRFRAPTGCMGGAPPPPACFDNPASYTWDMYRITAGDLEFASSVGGVCTAWTTLVGSGQATAFTVQFQDASPITPPGGEPAVSNPADNNMVVFTIQWTDPVSGRTHDFTAQTAIRAGPYSDVNTGMANSAAVSPPPAACP